MTTVTEPGEAFDASGFNIKLSARMPNGDANGLRDQARLLVQYPRERRYAVVEFTTARVIGDVDNDTDTAVIRLLRVEIVDDGDATKLLLEAANRRGHASLFDSEHDDE